MIYETFDASGVKEKMLRNGYLSVTSERKRKSMVKKREISNDNYFPERFVAGT